MALLPRRADDPAARRCSRSPGRNVERAAALLRDLLADYPERAELARELVALRARGRPHRPRHHPPPQRRCTARSPAPRPARRAPARHRARRHRRLRRAGRRQAGPLPRRGADGAGARSSPTCSSAPASRSAGALRALRSGVDLAPHLVEIHRLENEGDRISRDAVASLFDDGIDPMVVIRWKDIFDVARGRRRRLRAGRPRARGHRAAAAVGAQGRRVRRPASCAATAFLPRRTARTARTWRSRPLSPSRCAARAAPVRSARWSGPSRFTES